ncbi:cytosine permease [Actinomadura miaoliensis]|uniref:Cytosine permease n=1 Tax=Actinomadura miaoliensis TaxID=430685 RepID=A0ABP7UW83_9ACTN
MPPTDRAELTASQAAIGNDDFALRRVPRHARHHWFAIAAQRFGQVSALSQFMLGATLGMGMTFWHAVGAITLGAVILEIVAILVGVIGVREGLSTSVLARWTGFGGYGAALIGLTIAISLVGWFGVQNAVFAEGLHELLGGLPLWAWTVVAGAFVTAIVVYGIGGMRWIAFVTVPLFLALAGWSIVSELSRHSLGALISSPAPGPPLSLTAAATLVAGSFIAGAVITPDMTRYNRGVADVVKQTVIGITLGEYVIGLIGVLLAHATGTGNVVSIVTSTSGPVGTVVLIAATLKINDWNLYSSSLGLVNVIHTLTGRRTSRVLVTIGLGAAGTLLAAIGILDRFTDFLTLLGVAIPPIAGIMVAEYFVIRRWRPDLDAAGDTVPSRAPGWVPATMVVWSGAFLVGEYVAWGVPALNSLIVAFVGYVVAGRLGLTRGTGVALERSN